MARGVRGGTEIRLVPIRRISTEDLSPRLSVDVGRFEGLRRSIQEIGIIQPLLLRKTPRGYSLICGHQRLLAARHLGWTAVPSRVLQVTERQALHIRLAENLHRESLSKLELAEAFERLFLSTAEGTREMLGASLGLSEERVKELVNLLKATPEARERMIYGLSASEGRPERHAREGIRLADVPPVTA